MPFSSTRVFLTEKEDRGVSRADRPEARSASPGVARAGWAPEEARQRPALMQAERSFL